MAKLVFIAVSSQHVAAEDQRRAMENRFYPMDVFMPFTLSLIFCILSRRKGAERNHEWRVRKGPLRRAHPVPAGRIGQHYVPE